VDPFPQSDTTAFDSSGTFIAETDGFATTEDVFATANNDAFAQAQSAGDDMFGSADMDVFASGGFDVGVTPFESNAVFETTENCFSNTDFDSGKSPFEAGDAFASVAFSEPQARDNSNDGFQDGLSPFGTNTDFGDMAAFNDASAVDNTAFGKTTFSSVDPFETNPDCSAAAFPYSGAQPEEPFTAANSSENTISDEELARRLQAEEDVQQSIRGSSMAPSQPNMKDNEAMQRMKADEEMARRLAAEENPPPIAKPAPPPVKTSPAATASPKKTGTYLTMKFEKIILGESMKLGDCKIAVTVQGPGGNTIDFHDNISPKKAPGTVNELTLSGSVMFQKPLEDMPPNSAVIFEFKHYKTSESKHSVRCWTASTLNQLFQSTAKSPCKLPLNKKPTLFDTKKKPVLLNKTSCLLIRCNV